MPLKVGKHVPALTNVFAGQGTSPQVSEPGNRFWFDTTPDT
jgi:hypothetical protein